MHFRRQTITRTDRDLIIINQDREYTSNELKRCRLQDVGHSVQASRRLPRFLCMMTPSNGNIFRVTGPLCGEFTGPR